MTNETEMADPKTEMKIRGAIAKRAMELSPEKALKLFVTDRAYAVNRICDSILGVLVADPSISFKDALESVFDQELERIGE